MDEEKFQRVAVVSDIDLRKTRCIEVQGREVLLCHTTEGFFAVDNICTHAAARLCDGRLKGHRVLCPLHGAAFDVRDGAALSRPATQPLRTHLLRIEGEDILIAVSSDDD